MKIPCPEHGAHFGDETAEIIACDTVWQRWNLDKLDYAHREELLTWLVEIPSDKIFIETGWGIGIGLFGEYIGYDKALAGNKEYEDMSEEQRRAWQKNDMLAKYNQVKGRKKWQFWKKR